MLKLLLLLACVAGSMVVISCDDDDTKPTGDTDPAGETIATGQTKDTGQPEPAWETKPTKTGSTNTDETRCGVPTCGKNQEYYNCTGGCIPRLCSELGFPLDCKKCTPGCVCKSNYVRADNGTCILIKDCPSCGGDRNAEQGCGNNCGRTCADYNKPPRPCPPGCIFNGCNCRKGFYYDKNIKACVKPEDCTPICQANEEYSPCINGGCDARNCSQFGKPVPCVKLRPEACIKGCVCVKGYLRAANGTCVPKDQCKPYPPICGKNQEYYNCSGGCTPQRCSEIGFPLDCEKKCTPGCVCKSGYVRADDETCIPIPDCPSCGGDKNAVQGCSNYCGHTCSDYNKPRPFCPLFCMVNGCDCRKGFVYDSNIKACVKPEDCTPICKANEEYSSCTNGGCDARNCSQFGKPVPCVKLPPEACIKGCVCVKGYLRAANGTCVPKDQCKPYPPICGKNQEYYNCSGGCTPQRCSEIGFPLDCEKKCTPGCVCKSGYVRADDETCIPIPDCPSCGGDKNAEQGCGNNCGRTCADYNKPPRPCPPGCIFNGCDCRKGFYYDKNIKACVKPEDCTPICQANEEYSSCINGGCDARNCSQFGKPVPCVRLRPEACIKGCVCVKDYLRAANGTCVPKDQCKPFPPICGKNQEYYNCSGGCTPQRCSEIGFPLDCEKKCTPGCVCKSGYVRADDETCIPIPDCPSCGGDKNAVQGCSNYCGHTCSDYNKPRPFCPLFCMVNGCDCRKGFVYDSNIKACVKPADCTPICQANEEYSSCTNGGCDARNCSQVGKPVPCVKLPPEACIKGCVCVKGYLRAANGTCVLKDQCKPYPTICGKNQEYYNCSGGCTPQRCSEIGFPLDCEKKCTPGCVCKPGYVRADDETCIPIPDCPSCGGDKNAVQGCSNYCGHTCYDYNKPRHLCPLFCLVNGCDCRKGFVYDSNIKACVKPEDCTPNCQAVANEEYSSCINGGCDARNCSQFGKPVPCVKLRPEACIKGCVCVKDYLRAANGTCVPKDQCTPKCDKPNEVYDECLASCPPRRCDLKDALVKCKAPPKPGDPECKPGCRCADNYYRNATGTCVLKKNCEKPLKCDKPNEVYKSCPILCPSQECSVNPALIRCIRNAEYGDPSCQPSCVCIDGYVRNDARECIPRDKCPKPCGQNEYWEPCIQDCRNQSCNQYGRPASSCPLRVTGECNSGCRCKPKHYRNSDGVCIPQDECPHNCGKNEHWENCFYNCGGNQTCDDIGKKYNCPAKVECQSGCRCDKGYWKNGNNVCIPESQCPKPCGQNEYWEPCIQDCRNQSCNEYGRPPSSCPARIAGECNSGCRCKPKHYRNSDGVCIPQDQCPQDDQCPGQNEYYEPCIQGCSNQTCDTIGMIFHCPIQTTVCKTGCRCKPDFYRNASNVCVSESECGCKGDPNAQPGCGLCKKTCASQNIKESLCPRIACKPTSCDCKDGYVFDSNLKKCVLPKDCTPICGLNEQYDSCTNGGCGNKNCSQIGQPIKCVKISPESCIKGCSCVTGYLRAKNGTCVPEDQCPVSGCGDDPNAKPGCGVNCGKTCSSYKNKPVACPLICKVGGCDCKDGFVFDNNIGKCILPQQCTPICGRNEQYSSCINGGCGRRNCSQLGQPELCVDPIAGGCIKGCICATGYLRADNGTCVPQDQCPTSGCGGDPNAKPGCGYNCGKTCSSYKIKKPLCPRIVCKPTKCDCKDGYVFDSNLMKCVLPQECTPICGLNEQYDSCTNGGCGHKNCSQLGQPQICIDRTPESCTKGCTCISGYLRANNGTCVPQDQCPVTGCGGDPNAQPGCGVNCGKTCIKTSICPKICKVGGCDCKDGFLFDSNLGKCVLPKQCTNCNKPNEVYDTCIAPCPPRRCDVDDSLIRCAAPPKPGDPECKSGCRCADGYARNATGTCVLREQCEKPLTCDRPNEIYDPCFPPCPGDSCNVDPALVLCTPGPQYGDAACKPSCRCIDGYARNSDNLCVPRDQCPNNQQCSGQNESFDTCISGCSNQTCETIGQIFNCPIQPAVCRTGCRCNPGFYRNASNVCVPESQCPTPPCPEGEIYSRCPTVPCEGDYCPKTRDSPLTCPVGIVCDKPRCVCSLLNRRDRKTGKCINAANCPPFKCDGPNESYQSCPATCPGEKCADYLNNSKCPRYRIGIVVPCKPQCRCNKGYYRNDNGTCVLASQCGPVIKTTPRTPVISNCTGSTTNNTTTTGSGGNYGPASGNGLVSLQAGATRFNGKFLYDRMKANPGDNTITSPISAFTPMAQLALYAAGEAFKQLISVLNLSSKQDIRDSFPALTASFDGQTSVNFSTASKVYCNEKYPLSDGFKKDSVDVIHAEAQELDFSKNTEAANIINSWVESKTNNRIKDLIQASDLSSLTRLVLVNAIYFKGDWLYSFNKTNTQDTDFYLSDGTTKKTKLMYQKGDFKYGEIPDLDCTALEMLYKGKNFSMVIILPNKNDGVLSLAETLQDETKFNSVLGSLGQQTVEVYVPPFEINTSTDLGDILKQEGITTIFNETDSGLSGILENPEKTYVSKAIQKAFIKVDETGSEAAAANGVVVGRPRPGLPPPPPVVFRADHAFLFYLRVQSTIFFCGAYNQ